MLIQDENRLSICVLNFKISELSSSFTAVHQCLRCLAAPRFPRLSPAGLLGWNNHRTWMFWVLRVLLRSVGPKKRNQF